MVGWLISLNGAVTIGVLAMLSFIGYSLLVYRYVIEQLMPGISSAVWQTVFVLLLLGGWIWSLFSTVSGNKAGLVVALICASLPALFSLYDLVFHTPIPYGWPLVQISVWTTFILCLVAVSSLAYQLIIHGKVG